MMWRLNRWRVSMCVGTMSLLFLGTVWHGGWFSINILPGRDLCNLPQGLDPRHNTLARNSASFEPWPEKQNEVEHARGIARFESSQEEQFSVNTPAVLPPVVHYLWCGRKKFRFGDYLSVLSAIQLLQPIKLVFHCTHQPQTDSYNTWFQDLKSEVAGLELHQLPTGHECGSKELLSVVLQAVSSDGGVLVGSGIILSNIPKLFTGEANSFLAFKPDSRDKTLGVAFFQSGFDEATKASHLNAIDKLTSTESVSSSHRCVTTDVYNTAPSDSLCVIVPDVIHPRDIIEAETPFAELARWLFYGRRALALPRQDFNNLIPRVSHYVRLQGGSRAEDRKLYREEFSFNHMLSVLSALYVAGFQHVFLHVEGPLPSGRWWDELMKEKNVTVVKAIRPTSVFQNKVNVVQHVSDVLRYLTVYKYGGAYQDFDVTWASPIPDSLLAYPAVAGFEWEQSDRDWPESFNLGVFLARPGSEWLRHYIHTHKDFRDNNWGYNSLRMSYKTYELYPHHLLADRKLQVICCNGVCHPVWEQNYQKSGVRDSLPTMPSSWQEVRAIHVTCPKPHPSLSSPENVKSRKDMIAELGRTVLKKSGRKHLIS